MGGKGQLSGKMAPFMGASAGLGAHFAERLAARGAEVSLVPRRVAALDAIVQKIQGDRRIDAISLDVADSASCAGLVETAGQINTLINNASPGSNVGARWPITAGLRRLASHNRVGNGRGWRARGEYPLISLHGE